MLTRPIFNNLKKQFAAGLDEAARAAFAKLPYLEQAAKLRAVVPAEMADDAAVAGFILVFNVKSNLVAAGSPEHFAMRKALGLPDPKPWHKERPPRTSWEMSDSSRSPSWLDESQAMSAIARTMTFEDLRAGPEVMAAAIRAYFKFGGLEDLGDPRAVQPTDTTMKLILEGVGYALAIVRPDWHDETGTPFKVLPAGVDARSAVEITEELDRQEKLRRNEEARERNRVRREKELAEYGALRSEVMAKFRCDASAALARELASEEFDAVSASHEVRVVKALDPTYRAIFDLVGSRVTVPDGAGADEVTEIRNDTAAKAAGLTVQLVLEDVNEHQAGWLRRLSNGDFKFRPQPLKGDVRPPGYVTKKEKAAARAIWRIYSEYGEDTLNFALNTIVGQKLAGPAQIVKMPDWLKIKGGTEEIDTTSAEAPATPGAPEIPAGKATLPPPPPPPAANTATVANTANVANLLG